MANKLVNAEHFAPTHEIKSDSNKTWRLPRSMCPAAEPTLVFLGRIVVVDLLSNALALAKVPRQIFLLLLVVVAEELFPVVWIHILFLLDDLPLHLLLHTSRCTD